MSRTRRSSVRTSNPAGRTPAHVRRAARAAVEMLEGRALLATTVVAVADADVRNVPGSPQFSAANYGVDPFLRVNGDSDDRSDAYLKFDLSGVASIGSASLILRGART